MKWFNVYRMRLVLVGIVAAIMLGGGSAKADFIWTQKADMPTPRWMLSASVVHGKIYAIGGRTSEPDNVRFSTVEEYDPTTDTWIRKADMPTARDNFATSVVSGRIYAIGGTRGGWSTAEEYDPSTDTWTRKADMPTPRRSLATCTVDGKIYAIGGSPQGNLSGLKTVEEYDPVTDTWTRKADMPRGVWGLCTCVVDGMIYALGGRPELSAQPYVQEYNPATDTWTRKANMPIATSQMASVVLGGKIVVIGGWLHSNDPPYTTVQIYDPDMDLWTVEAETPFLRACFSASAVNNKIYVMGGTDRPHPCPATSTVYELGPVVDLNGDGTVDAADMCILVDHWGTDNSLCDIGPTPWGDGIVDVEDLKVLAEYLFTYPGTTAYWKLDEMEGDIAYDSAHGYDGVLIGGPIWRPDGGMMDGALHFDGIDDFVGTDFVLNPADGVFSVLAWIKGGAPGQVVISQADGVNWLSADPSAGKLMTSLSHPQGGRTLAPPPLVSESVITDEAWHCIGFVCDGLCRTLYVDGTEVAKDPVRLSGLESAEGGLYFGVGSNLAPSTFFSGLIDDIRIYNRVVTP
jgi:N-acetylneuraminic acid mutarotase